MRQSVASVRSKGANEKDVRVAASAAAATASALTSASALAGVAGVVRIFIVLAMLGAALLDVEERLWKRHKFGSIDADDWNGSTETEPSR